MSALYLSFTISSFPSQIQLSLALNRVVSHIDTSACDMQNVKLIKIVLIERMAHSVRLVIYMAIYINIYVNIYSTITILALGPHSLLFASFIFFKYVLAYVPFENEFEIVPIFFLLRPVSIVLFH